MDLADVLDRHVRRLFRSSPDYQSLGAVRLALLQRVARVLRIPLDPLDLFDGDGRDRRIVLSESSVRGLDEAWFRLTGAFGDDRVSPQERLVRDQLFVHAPFYADVRVLARFVDVLAARDSVRLSDAGNASFSDERGKVPRANGDGAAAAAGGDGAAAAAGGERGEAAAGGEGAAAAGGERGEAAGEEEGGETERPRTSDRSCRSKSGVLNRVLAVDGFRGIYPSSYRNYVSHLNDRSTDVEKTHLEAVRTLYGSDLFEEGRRSGTFAAACVFVALLRLFVEAAGDRVEDSVLSAAYRADDDATRYVEDHEDFLLDAPCGDRDGPLARLARTYRGELADERVLEWIAFDRLRSLSRATRRAKRSSSQK